MPDNEDRHAFFQCPSGYYRLRDISSVEYGKHPMGRACNRVTFIFDSEQSFPLNVSYTPACKVTMITGVVLYLSYDYDGPYVTQLVQYAVTEKGV